MALASGLSFAVEPADGWRWYYAAYGAPGSASKLYTRSGVARVAINGGVINIDFRDDASSEASSFVGTIKGARISGKLTNFFPSGDETKQGDYRERRVSNCKWQQFSIWPEYPDGSVLIVSRINGRCQ